RCERRRVCPDRRAVDAERRLVIDGAELEVRRLWSPEIRNRGHPFVAGRADPEALRDPSAARHVDRRRSGTRWREGPCSGERDGHLARRRDWAGSGTGATTLTTACRTASTR